NIVDVQDAERKRIAEDLHDQLGGTLSAVKGMLSSAPEAAGTAQAQAVLDEACNDLRFIAHSLMPAAFAQQTLATAISELVQKANSHGKINISFLTHGDAVAINKQTELTVFRMASEMVQNVLKHSGAHKATVQLLYFDDGLQLMVEDNGHGFDNQAKSSGIGLKNLYSRAKYINATLTYDSGPEGTTAICIIPFPANH
ncbi:MAG TPA: ATP-binding protein, partial [Flavisolibacter sp.]|nr:ATP-binding protein [Flavisolibacter sp.]